MASILGEVGVRDDWSRVARVQTWAKESVEVVEGVWWEESERRSWQS